MTTSAIGTHSGPGDVSPDELGSARTSTDTRGGGSNRSRSFDTAWSQFRERFGRAGFVSFEELVQAFFKLYKTLDFTGMTEARRMQFEAFNLKVKAAEENYKSAMMSGITTIAILAPGVAIGTGLAGAGLYKHFKGDGVGATKSASNGQEKHGIVDPSLGGVQKKPPTDEVPAAQLTKLSTSSTRGSAESPFRSVDSSRESSFTGSVSFVRESPRQSPHNGPPGNGSSQLSEHSSSPSPSPSPSPSSSSSSSSSSSPVDAISPPGASNGSKPSPDIQSVGLSVKAADTDWRGPFQGVAMFMLPSGSSAAGEMAGAEPQKQSDILKALADIVEDYVRQLTERSSSWDQGVRQLAQTLASN